MLKQIQLKWLWAIVIVTTIAISYFYPQQLGVLLVKVNSLAVGAVGGYWLDRFTRPAVIKAGEEVYFEFRQAILIAAGVIGVALAL